MTITAVTAVTAGGAPRFGRQEQLRLGEVARFAAQGNIEALLELLTCADWVVRRAVTEALARAGDAAVQPLCDLLTHERHHEGRIAAIVDALAATQAAVEDALVALVACIDPAVVADAAQILGRRGSPKAIPTLIPLLAHADDNVAVAAIEALGAIGCGSAVEALIATVRSGNFFRVFPSIDVLGRSGDPRVIAPLAALLQNPQYALEAARALGRTGNKAAIGPLRELLQASAARQVRVAAQALADLRRRYHHRYGQVLCVSAGVDHETLTRYTRRLGQVSAEADNAEQIAVCEVLAALGDASAVPVLCGLLHGTTAVVQAAADALHALGSMGEPALLAALRTGQSERRRTLLPWVGSSASADDVVLCLTDESPDVRALACAVLARIGQVSVVPALFPLLADANRRVSHAAIGAIQSLGCAEGHRLAARAVDSADPVVRCAGLQILAYLGHEPALPAFLGALADADARVRQAALQGLPFLDDPQALEALLAAAGDVSPRGRAQAMRALGLCAPQSRIVACLTRGLGDVDAWVRYFACQSLGKLVVEEASADIAARLQDEAGQVRVAAVEALSCLGSPDALVALRTAAITDDADMQRAALIGLGLSRRREFVPTLLQASQATGAATRLVALSALAGMDAPEALDALAQGIMDPDENVRTAAVGFLAAHPAPEATCILIEQLGRRGTPASVFAALARPGPGRIAGIMQALEFADEPMARDLAAALVRLGGADAALALRPVLDASNPAARKAAVTALSAVGSDDAQHALRRAMGDRDGDVRRIAGAALAQWGEHG